MLYELEKNIIETINKYYDCFNEDTGEQIASDEVVEEIKKELGELENKKDDLKERILKKRANNIANSSVLRNEISRLADIKASVDKKIIQDEKFLEYLFKKDLEKNKSFLFSNWKIGYRKSEAVKLAEDFNNTDYLVEKISFNPDKTKIKQDLKD